MLNGPWHPNHPGHQKALLSSIGWYDMVAPLPRRWRWCWGLRFPTLPSLADWGKVHLTGFSSKPYQVSADISTIRTMRGPPKMSSCWVSSLCCNTPIMEWLMKRENLQEFHGISRHPLTRPWTMIKRMKAMSCRKPQSNVEHGPPGADTLGVSKRIWIELLWTVIYIYIYIYIYIHWIGLRENLQETMVFCHQI